MTMFGPEWLQPLLEIFSKLVPPVIALLRPACAIYKYITRAKEPHTIPPLKSPLLERRNHFNIVKTILLASTEKIVGLTGQGGVGKTVLAQMLAHDRDIREHFFVVWLDFDRTKDPIEAQQTLAERFDHNAQIIPNIDIGKMRLCDLTTDKRALIILDNVWDDTQANAFTSLGEQCRLVITTRISAILNRLGAKEHPVNVLDEEEALDLLRQEAAWEQKSLPPRAREIVAAVGYLPLAITVLAAVLKHRGVTWESLYITLTERGIIPFRTRTIPRYTNPNIWVSLALSVECLPEDTQKKAFKDCAVFREGALITLSALTVLWDPYLWQKGSADEARDLAERFVERFLLECNGIDTYRLHDLYNDFLQYEVSEKISLHNRLLSTYLSTTTPPCWPKIADDGYIFDNLTWHLHSAERIGEMLALFSSDAWFNACKSNGKLATYFSDVVTCRRIAESWLRRARSDNERHTALRWHIHCALLQASIISLANNVSGEFMALCVQRNVLPWKQAIALARQSLSESSRALALGAILPHIPGDEHHEMVRKMAREILPAVRALTSRATRIHSIITLLPYLEEGQYADVVREVKETLLPDESVHWVISDLADLAVRICADEKDVYAIMHVAERQGEMPSLIRILSEKSAPEWVLQVLVYDLHDRVRYNRPCSPYFDPKGNFLAWEVVELLRRNASAYSSFKMVLQRARWWNYKKQTHYDQNIQSHRVAFSPLLVDDDVNEAIQPILAICDPKWQPPNEWRVITSSVEAFAELYARVRPSTRRMILENALCLLREYESVRQAGGARGYIPTPLEQLICLVCPADLMRSAPDCLKELAIRDALDTLLKQFGEPLARIIALMPEDRQLVAISAIQNELENYGPNIERRHVSLFAALLQLGTLSDLDRKWASDWLAVLVIAVKSGNHYCLSTLAAICTYINRYESETILIEVLDYAKRKNVLLQVLGKLASAVAMYVPQHGLLAAADIHEANSRMNIIERMAPHLPTEDLAGALELVGRIGDDDAQRLAISALASRLSRDIRVRKIAFKEALDIEDVEMRFTALMTIMECVSAKVRHEVWLQALHTARKMSDVDIKAMGLSRLSCYEPAIAREAFAAVRRTRSAEIRGHAFKVLGPILPESMVEDCLDEINNLMSPSARAEGMSGIFNRLSPEKSHFELDRICHALRKCGSRGRIVCATLLRPYMSPPEASLATMHCSRLAPYINDHRERAQAFVALADNPDFDNKESALKEAFYSAGQLPELRERADVMRSLMARHAVDVNLGQLQEIWIDTANQFAVGRRMDALICIANLAAVVELLGGVAVIQSSISSIESIVSWIP